MARGALPHSPFLLPLRASFGISSKTPACHRSAGFFLLILPVPMQVQFSPPKKGGPLRFRGAGLQPASVYTWE